MTTYAELTTQILNYTETSTDVLTSTITDDFIEQPKVINGASDLIVSVFGNYGMHTRAAVSTNSLPLGAAVEIDAIFEI